MPSEAAVSELVDEVLPNYLPDFTATPVAEEPASDSDSEPAPTESTASATVVPAPYTNSTMYVGSPDVSPVTEGSSPSGGLEESTERWRPSHAALTLVPGRKGQAIRVTRKGNRETFAFYAAKRPVTKKAGEQFKARAYVRTTSPGMYVCLRVQEYGGGVPTTTERCAAAKAGWRRVALRGMSTGKGHKLVFSVHVMAALGGTSFDVDGFRLSATS